MSSKPSVFAEGESFQTGSAEKLANMEAFVEWLLLPAPTRLPQTRQAFAEVLGVTTQTLRNYGRDPFVIRSLQTRRREVFKVEKLGTVIDDLFLRAADATGDFPAAANTASKILLDWANVQTTEMSAEALREMPDSKLRELLVQMFDQLGG